MSIAHPVRCPLLEASNCQAAQPESGPAVQPEQQLDAPGSIEKPKQPAVNPFHVMHTDLNGKDDEDDADDGEDIFANKPKKKPDLPLCDECVSSEEVSQPVD